MVVSRTFFVLVLMLVAGCGASDDSSSDSRSASDTPAQTSAADPDAVMSACRNAAEALGYEVTDGREPFSVDFMGLILSPGTFVQIGRDDGVVVQGDAAVLQQAHEYCDLSTVPGNCLDVPLVAVTAGGAWAVVEQPVPTGPAGVPTNPAPVNDPECLATTASDKIDEALKRADLPFCDAAVLILVAQGIDETDPRIRQLQQRMVQAAPEAIAAAASLALSEPASPGDAPSWDQLAALNEVVTYVDENC